MDELILENKILKEENALLLADFIQKIDIPILEKRFEKVSIKNSEGVDEEKEIEFSMVPTDSIMALIHANQKLSVHVKVLFDEDIDEEDKEFKLDLIRRLKDENKQQKNDHEEMMRKITEYLVVVEEEKNSVERELKRKIDELTKKVGDLESSVSRKEKEIKKLQTKPLLSPPSLDAVPGGKVPFLSTNSLYTPTLPRAPADREKGDKGEMISTPPIGLSETPRKHKKHAGLKMGEGTGDEDDGDGGDDEDDEEEERRRKAKKKKAAAARKEVFTFQTFTSSPSVPSLAPSLAEGEKPFSIQVLINENQLLRDKVARLLMKAYGLGSSLQPSVFFHTSPDCPSPFSRLSATDLIEASPSATSAPASSTTPPLLANLPLFQPHTHTYTPHDLHDARTLRRRVQELQATAYIPPLSQTHTQLPGEDGEVREDEEEWLEEEDEEEEEEYGEISNGMRKRKAIHYRETLKSIGKSK